MNKKKIALAVLASLSVACGAIGLSACSKDGNGNNTNDINPQIYAIYQLYAEAAGSGAMTYEEWYADLLENAKGDKGDPGDPGGKGDPGEPGAPGKPGVSVTDIEVEYIFDSDGNQIMRFKFHMSDGTVQTVDVAVPKVVRNMSLRDRSVPITAEGIPEMYLEVTYVDETSDAVRITEDMISGDYDFTQKGETSFTVTYNGKQETIYVKVYDPANPEISGARLDSSVGTTFIMTTAEVSSGEYNFGDLHWELEYEDGSSKRADFSKDHITNLENLTASVTEYPVTLSVQYPGVDGSCTIEVRVVESIEATSYRLDSHNTIYCKINEEPDLSGLHIIAATNDGRVMLKDKVTAEMLQGFDKTQSGRKENITVKFKEQEIGQINIFVYEGEPSVSYEVQVSSQNFKINGSFPAIYARYIKYTKYTAGNESISESDYENAENFKITEDMIQGDKPDFTTVGEKIFTVEYKQAKNRVNIYMYDPAVCNISNISVNSYDEIEVKSTDNIIEKLVEALGEAKMGINYFEPVNGETYKELPLTEDIIRAADISKVDTKLGGYYEVYMTYGGYKFYVTINVTVELGEPICTLTSEQPLSLVMYGFRNMSLYEGNIAKITAAGMDDDSSDILFYYELSDEDKTLILKDSQGVKQGIFTVEINENTGTIAAYDFSSLKPTGTYAITNSDALDGAPSDLQVKLYDNGFLVFGSETEHITMVYSYEKSGNNITTKVDYMYGFVITGDGTCEIVVDY